MGRGRMAIGTHKREGRGMIVNFLRKITLLGGVLLISMLIGGRSSLAFGAIEQVFLDFDNTVSTWD